MAQLEAVVRYSPFVNTGETQFWAGTKIILTPQTFIPTINFLVEVFARDVNGVIYHLESEKDIDTQQNKFVLLNTGNYASVHTVFLYSNLIDDR